MVAVKVLSPFVRVGICSGECSLNPLWNFSCIPVMVLPTSTSKENDIWVLDIHRLAFVAEREGGVSPVVVRVAL